MKLFSILASAAVLLFASGVQANDITNFRPVYKLRGDLQCWPTDPANGNNSGLCRSKSDFIQNQPLVYTESYSENVNGKQHRLITYWSYFGNQNTCTTFASGHVDDWENVTVHLVDGQLTHVTYSQHNGRYTIRKQDAELEGIRPIVYVGKYSHGSYHDQRSRLSADGWAFLTGRYCYYWRDPRGPGEIWSPGTADLDSVGQNSYFPGSTNPLQRDSRPYQYPVCRTDGGRVVAGIIDGTENTCERNPDYLKDETMTLRDMFYLSVY